MGKALCSFFSLRNRQTSTSKQFEFREFKGRKLEGRQLHCYNYYYCYSTRSYEASLVQVEALKIYQAVLYATAVLLRATDRCRCVGYSSIRRRLT